MLCLGLLSIKHFHHGTQRKIVRCIECFNIKNNIFLRSVIVGTEFNNSAYFRGPSHMLMYLRHTTQGWRKSYWTDFVTIF